MKTITDLERRIARMEEALADAAAGTIRTIDVTDEDPFSSLEIGLNLVLEDLRDEIEASAELNRGLDQKVAERTAELEEKLRTISEQNEVIGRQQEAILELSTPVLQIWDGVLALPVIGEIDTRRSAQLMENVLEAISQRQARFVILDITGVEIVDTGTAQHFLRTIKAAELLGVECILTGIRPSVAKTLVSLGFDLSEVRTCSTMQQGLELCMRLMAGSSSLGEAGDDDSVHSSDEPAAKER